ncbi:serine/threonine-protein kinase [Ramlibacter sp. WS9]|uniref:serine/threonine-protein kinase n=1 Tax=Ramlibacter sp. WS9 TaxID=1882741 RepID=UPI0011447F2C|nr:serine/threonine-protein kinase [Ramlibacter sp. WS9]ROZ72411.1 serine/threonine protein kinase [Ramlibacter sp. WS9]
MSLKKLGRYDLVRVLGKGAMGVVYEGRDPNLDRRVAIKTVKVENLSEEAATEYEHRFRTEARSAARLQHPNIVSVYDSDRDGDIAFLVMEYIHGDDLKHHLDKGVRYSLEQSLKMVRDLLSALDYAHKQNIVHRDVKPANLLIEPGGRVKLTDFGVARIQDSGEATRTQGSMVGTLKYMSPEQVQGQKIDSRADLFSVGVVLYQLLTDKRPFDGDNDFSIIHQIIGHTPAAPSTFNGRLPTAIDAVVARALAKDRDQRFATARDFASALQSAIRRAEDATVVPPANPLKTDERAGTGSKPGRTGTNASATTPGGGTVTQELELVYWKDIKDSTEPDEIEGFLLKFPDGIYADLARKRLRKLEGSGIVADQTILSDTRIRLDQDQDLDATRLLHSGTTPSVIAPPVAPAGPATEDPTAPPGAKADASVPLSGLPHDAAVTLILSPGKARGTVVYETDFPETIVAPDEAAWAAGLLPKEAPPAPSDAPAPAAKPAAKPVKKAPVGLWVAAGAVAVAGIAAIFLFVGRGDADPAASAPLSAASAPASAAAPPVAVAAAPEPGPAEPTPSLTVPPAAGPGVPLLPAPASSSPVPSAAQPARFASAAAAKPASAPRRVASAVKPKAAPASVAEPPRPVPSEPRREEPRVVASAPVPVLPTVSPVDDCKDRVFLSREFCLAEQCAKPGTRNHPLCIKRREEIRLREDSKVRQGPQ